MKTILVIRESDIFSRILAENGFKIINLPTIETSAINDLSDFEAKLGELENFDGIFLTSKNSAQILAEKIREKNIAFTGKVYILGKRSFEILREENLNLVYDESANTAREIFENISLEELKDKSFLFIRGEKSLQTIPEILADFANVDEITVYKTRDIKINFDKINSLSEKFSQNKVAAACFFSPSGAESFIKQFGAEILHQTVIATIGKTTADFFERRDLTVDFVSRKATAESFAIELIDFLRKSNLPAEHAEHAERREKFLK